MIVITKTSISKKILFCAALFFCLAPMARCTLNEPSESFLRELLLLRPCVPRLLGGNVQGCALNLTGTVTSIAGDGTAGSVDGTGIAAQFNTPQGMTTDGTYLYMATLTGRRIRQIEIATGVVTTLAGNGTSGSLDGTGTAATFTSLRGITTDGEFLYLVDQGSHRIRKIEIATGVVSTLAGSSTGFLDATGTAAQFANPLDVTTDGTFLYIADQGNHRIRKIEISSGIVTTFAGSTAGYLDGTGTGALFDTPNTITVSGSSLFVNDTGNQRIRRIDIASGMVTTFAGDGTTGFVDGTGTAASFGNVRGLATDGTYLYVSEQNNNHAIRKIEIATGIVTTLAGNGTGVALDGTGTAAQFNLPTGVITDGVNLYVAGGFSNLIRKIE